MNKKQFIRKWKPRAWFKENQKLYDKFESDLDELLQEEANKGWVASWKESNERCIAELEYRDREYKTFNDYWKSPKKQTP